MIRDILDALSTSVPDAIDLDPPLSLRPEFERINEDFLPPRRILRGTSDTLFGEILDPDVDQSDLFNSLIWDGDGEPVILEPTSAIQRAIKTNGFDALALYRSFHFGENQWGIYILEDGLHAIAHDVFAKASSEPLKQLQLALKLLHSHEFFHFLADIATTSLELTLCKRLYVPRFYNLKNSNPRWSVLEEGLANAFALRRFWNSRFRSGIEWYMSSQPEGYRNFSQWLKGIQFQSGQQKLAKDIVSYCGDSREMLLGDLLFDTQRSKFPEAYVPVYILPSFRVTKGSLRFIRCLPHLTETDRFSKDLDSLPAVVSKKWLQKKRLLEKNVQHPSLNFEKIKNFPNTFSVRVDKFYRASLRQTNDKTWEALRVAAHDDLYAHPG